MRYQDRRILPAALAAAVVMAGGLSACGGGSSGKASQVAVKVNKDEITVLQVNEQLARLPAGVTPDQLEPATRRILGSLVNQQLLVQQAIERKLDRDPQILGALEAARLNILAKAYVERVISPQAKPSEQEVRKYYADNPALFAERKLYRLQELSIEATPEQAKEIEATAAGAKSLKQVADYLRDKKIPFGADSGVRAAEQLPLSHLAQIAALKAGSVLVFQAGNNRYSAIEVLASEPQPVDDKKAAPAIEQFLSSRKREELAAIEVKRLRDAAKLEYVGDFAKYAGDAPGALPAVAAGKPAPSDQDKGIAALH
jgi:EpsD family peptidyl-prolyl cis-trans isomerase